MRTGWLEVQLLGSDAEMPESATGQVLAKEGQVYRISLRNHHASRPGLCTVTLDGEQITEGGLVLGASKAVILERPVKAGEHGCFTVVAEGNTDVFGEDGGRENPRLGLIEVGLRLVKEVQPWTTLPITIKGNDNWGGPIPWHNPPTVPPPWNPSPYRPSPFWCGSSDGGQPGLFMPDSARPSYCANAAVPSTEGKEMLPREWKAAGTGLSGRSDQVFVAATIGALEAHEDVVALRLVIGSVLRPDTPRPLPRGEKVRHPRRPEPRA